MWVLIQHPDHPLACNASLATIKTLLTKEVAKAVCPVLSALLEQNRAVLVLKDNSKIAQLRAFASPVRQVNLEIQKELPFVSIAQQVNRIRI
jgi:adenosylmethionine-8-amino-7-oxononanoate aminotransferase